MSETDNHTAINVKPLSSLPEALRNRAERLLTESAFSEAQTFRSKNPEGIEWVQSAANTFLQMREYRIAEALYSHVIALNAIAIMVHAGLGVCAYHLGRFSDALRHVQKAISLLISHELSILEGVHDPMHGGNPIWQTSIPVKGLLMFGDTYVIGDARLSMFEHIDDSELPKNDEDYANIVMPDALFHFASFCWERGRYEIASNCLRMLLRIRPDDAKAQTNLGTCLAEAGELDQALKELEKALLLDPQDAIAHSGIGTVYGYLGDKSNALKHLCRAIEIKGGTYPFAEQQLENVRSGSLKRSPEKQPIVSAFLSYASEDKINAKCIADDLNRSGIDVWLDEWSILPGDSIIEKINEAIKDRRYFIPVLSPSFIGKPFPMRELQSAIMKQANDTRKYIIPVLIKPCELPELIKDIAYADLHSDYNSGIRKLLRALTN